MGFHIQNIRSVSLSEEKGVKHVSVTRLRVSGLWRRGIIVSGPIFYFDRDPSVGRHGLAAV